MAKKLEIWENVTVSGIADKGMAIGRDPEGKVIFLDGAVPGDVVDVKVLRKKKGIWQGITERIVRESEFRVQPKCEHFGNCGGCKWQDLAYDAQLEQKETIVKDAMKRIAKIAIGDFQPILGADQIFHYRNKMEFSFSNQRWKTREEIEGDKEIKSSDALGLHPPKFFNKVVDIENCWLQADPSNEIRNFVRAYAHDNKLSFYDPVKHTGYLRNMIVRNTTLNEWMLIMSFHYHDSKVQNQMLDAIHVRFPEITSLQYVINEKKNDTLFDQDIICYRGSDHISEEMGNLRFKVRPKSFFQTNVFQARRLYDLAVQYSDLKGDEIIYDLYTGTGTIALYLAQYCKTVIGIEEVDDAIADARENAEANMISNANFYVGDVKGVFSNDLMKNHGKPDVVVTDPPRGGMHEHVVKAILEGEPTRIVYISCNPATQARDIAILSEKYLVSRMQPLDMFPHTSHIENIAQLTLRI